jgi:PLAT/LH2 domain
MDEVDIDPSSWRRELLLNLKKKRGKPMKIESNITTMHSLKSRLVGWRIALFIAILVSAGTVFATPDEDDPVWRIQITIRTADIEDAGTDDGVRVWLNDNNYTWLDYGRDDFPRNNTFTYDLRTTFISHFYNLHYIDISKNGDDGLCLKSFTLRVNGRAIYTHEFPGSGHWLDTDPGYSSIYRVSTSTLRQDNSWLAYTQPFPPFVIPRAEIESRIEATVGHAVTGNRLQWGAGNLYGRAYVEASRKANDTLHVDLDLEADVPASNFEVDVDFDIRIRCIERPEDEEDRIEFQILNVDINVDADWYEEALTLGLIEIAEDIVTDEVRDGLTGISFDGVDVDMCPTIVVDVDGDINFSLPLLSGIQPLVKPSPATRVESGAAMEDGKGPLVVNIEVADQFKAEAETPFTLRVRSNRAEARNVNVRVTLPMLINPASTLIDVEDDKGSRQLGARFSVGENGWTLLDFSDRLEPGADNRYSLKVRFLHAPAAVLPINAAIAEESGEAEIKSTTFFRMENGDVNARATFKASKAAKTVPAADNGR